MTLDAEPKRQWLVYGAFLALGLGTLLPWNVFITAESYWQYKFRNTSAPANSTGPMTELQSLYTPLQMVLSQLPNFSFLLLNAVIGHRLSVTRRLVITLLLMVTLFSVTTAFVLVDTDQWQTGFFALTMTTIVLINSCGAMFQGSLFGLAGMVPATYMTAVVTGQAAGGVFASGARIVSLATGAGDTMSAFIYFLIAVCVMILTLLALLYLMATPLYKAVTAPPSHTPTDGTPAEAAPLSPPTDLLTHAKGVMAQIWPLGLCVVGVFAVTLSVFPALCVQVTSTYTGTAWADKYFMPVLTFLLFNVGDLVGRQLGGTLLWPRLGSRLIPVFTACRLLFLPLFAMCYRPTVASFHPAVFTSDVAYGLIMAAFSVSNGYLGALCMVYGPKSVADPKDAQTAGGVMAAMLGVGLVTGSVLSFGVRLI